jgi:hypothetical protein
MNKLDVLATCNNKDLLIRQILLARITKHLHDLSTPKIKPKTTMQQQSLEKKPFQVSRVPS